MDIRSENDPAVLKVYKKYKVVSEVGEDNGNIRFLSAISYIGVLFVIGHFAVEKNNPDLRFHTFQGVVLFVFFALLYSADMLICMLLSVIPELQVIVSLLLTLAISVPYLMLVVMGIVSAVKFEQKLLPFVGTIAVALRNKLDGMDRF